MRRMCIAFVALLAISCHGASIVWNYTPSGILPGTLYVTPQNDGMIAVSYRAGTLNTPFFKTDWLNLSGQVQGQRFQSPSLGRNFAPSRDGFVFESVLDQGVATLSKYDRGGLLVWESITKIPTTETPSIRPTKDGGCCVFARDQVYAFNAGGALKWTRNLFLFGSVFVEGLDGSFYHAQNTGKITKILPDGNEAWTRTFNLGFAPSDSIPQAAPAHDAGLFVNQTLVPGGSAPEPRSLAKISADGILQWKLANSLWPVTAGPEGLIGSKSSSNGIAFVLIESATGQVLSERALRSMSSIDSMTSIGPGELAATSSGNTASRISIVSPPEFLLYPKHEFAIPGSTVTLRSEGKSAWGKLYYQWRFEGGNIAGATNSLLTLTNLAESNFGRYSVVLSNDFALTIESPSANLIRTDTQLLLRMHPSLQVTGIIGKRYRVEYAENFDTPTWRTAGEFVLSENPFIWVDTSVQLPTQRFYRAIKVE